MCGIFSKMAKMPPFFGFIHNFSAVVGWYLDETARF